jgi:FkbM family methyltransferase
MAVPVSLKIQMFRLEKLLCQVLGVQAWRKLRGMLARKPQAFDEVTLVVDLLLPVCRSGLMVDVGAHHGESFRFFAFSGWKVIAFEPDPSPDKHAMIRARSTRLVTELRSAVSDQAGLKLPFFTSAESTGVSSLTPFLESHAAGEDFVTTDTLANCLKQHADGKQVDFLKIDTEGHDLFVLKGIDWSQQYQRPRVIICEFEDRKTIPLGYDYREMGDYLTARGYSVWISEWYPITKYGTQHRWKAMRRYPSEISDKDGWGNLIAVDRSLSDRAEAQWRPLLK